MLGSAVVSPEIRKSQLNQCYEPTCQVRMVYRHFKDAGGGDQAKYDDQLGRQKGVKPIQHGCSGRVGQGWDNSGTDVGQGWDKSRTGHRQKVTGQRQRVTIHRQEVTVHRQDVTGTGQVGVLDGFRLSKSGADVPSTGGDPFRHLGAPAQAPRGRAQRAN